jgi:hypothetical protein
MDKKHKSTIKSEERILKILSEGWCHEKINHRYYASGVKEDRKNGHSFYWICPACSKKDAFVASTWNLKKRETVKLCPSCSKKRAAQKTQERLKKEEEQKKESAEKAKLVFTDEQMHIKKYSKEEEQKILKQLKEKYEKEIIK